MEMGSPAKSSAPRLAEPDFSRGFGQTAKVVAPTMSRSDSGSTIRPPSTTAQPEVMDAAVADVTPSAVTVDAELVPEAPPEVLSATQLKKRKRVANKVKKMKKGR